MPVKSPANQQSLTVEPDPAGVGLRGYRVIDPARSAERRSAILAAAARVFSEKSYHVATMDDIAQEMGVTKGVVYYQFRSKEEVFTELLVTAISEALRRLRATLQEHDTPAEQLRAALAELIAFNLQETTPNHYAMMVIGSIGALTGQNLESVRALQREYQRTIADLIQDGAERGAFVPCDANVAAMNILTAGNGVSNWFVPGRSMKAAAVAEQVSQHLVRGILRQEHCGLA